ncbi:MAG: type II toxin-antitoxin system RelE/ParE family toxin [Thermosynechococcaceae cyanobacterium]
MSYKVDILPQALSEIEDSFRWIADNISAATAELWYEDLLEAVRSLEFFLNRCTIAPEAQEFDQEIRQLWVGKTRNYRVLFVVEANQVSILHIRHSSRAFLKKDSEQS